MAKSEIASLVEEQARRAKVAARALATVGSSTKDVALSAMAEAIEARAEELLAANAEDVKAAKSRGMAGALLDRLTLTPDRVKGMAKGLQDLVSLPDPVGRVTSMWRRPNGLQIGKVRVPLGVIGIIYEARPNVTADAAGLCVKAGNSVILRGGSEAINSNAAVAGVLREAAAKAGLPEDCIQLIEITDRAAAQCLMRLNGYVDALIPRGGAGLIQTVVRNATVPVIETGVGNRHTYVDEDADLAKAEEIAINAKTQRPGVCNAMETLLVHAGVAEEFLPRVCRRMAEKGVEIRGCERTRALVPEAKEASEEDWETEFLDLILAVRVVDDLSQALEHIEKYGSGHSEAIVTENYTKARRFLEAVDAAAVYVNASTRFTDGGEFGMGAEIGISTQKLHARGPMGLEELTTTKFIIFGDGQVRE